MIKDFTKNKLADLIAPQAHYDYYNVGFSDFASDGLGQFVGKSVELDVLSNDEKVFTVEVSMSTLKLSNQWYAICIFRDITNRKQEEDEIVSILMALDERNIKIAERKKKLEK